MMKLSARILSAFAGLILMVFGLMGAGGVHAQSTDPIGLILSTSGSVRAEDSQGNVRRLQRRSPVFEGDTLITGNRSRAQIRFNDNGLIALNPNTSFVVEEHKFSGQEDGQESATYRLVRGGLQAITGLIGHTNKDRYRVNTPLATIGLRGTHWAATFCDSTCDGNPPGLYGGVADGGIDVCNAGGCTPIDQDGYFYTPDANTKPATLLAAPSVVFSDTEETDDGSGDPDDASGDEADEGGEVADADDESDSSTTAPEDTETFVAEVLGTTDSDAGDTTGTSQTIEDDLAQSPSTGDDEQLVLETDDGDSLLLDDLNNGDVPDGDEPGDGEPVDEVVLEDNEVSNPAIEQVSAGAAGALASHIGTQDGSQSDSINVVVVPGSNDTDRLFTTQLDLDGDESDDATALAALDFEDPNGSGCDPCAFAIAPGEDELAALDEYAEVSVDGALVQLGRWVGDASISDSGTLLPALDQHHFVLSDLVASELPVVSEPLIATYSLVDATQPTDQFGALGTLTEADLDIDLLIQEIVDFDLGFNFADGRQITATINGSAPLSMGAIAIRDLALSGVCVDGACADGVDLSGSTGLSFVGTSGEGVVGAFSLTEFLQDGPANSFSGAYVLERALDTDPLEFVDADAQVVSVNTGLGIVAAIATTGDVVDSRFSFVFGGADTIGLTELYGATNLVASFQGTELEDFALSSGRLAEYDQYDLGDGQGLVSWGVWESASATFGAGDDISATTEAIPFLFSPSYVTGSIFSVTPSVVTYSYASGPSPVDELGNMGVINELAMELDLYFQTVTAFELDVDVADRNYLASLAQETAVATGSSAAIFALLGTCSGGDCGASTALTGDTAFQLAGLSGDIALGSFALDADTGAPDVALSGVYILEQSGSRAHPDWWDGTQDTETLSDGVSIAVATFGTDEDQVYGPLARAGVVGDQDYVDAAIHVSADVVTLDGRENLLVSYLASGNDSGESSLDDGFFSEEFSLDSGLLDEYGEALLSNGSLVTWGRWFSAAGAELCFDDSCAPTGSEQHFLVSDALVFDGEEADFGVSQRLSYSYLGGTSPTDEFGNVGQMIDASMEIDMFLQAITDFELSFDIQDRSYFATLPVSNSTFYFDLADDLDIDLEGTCVSGACGEGVDLEGYSSVLFVGDQAQGVLGSFALQQVMSYSDSLFASSLDAVETSTSLLGATGTFILSSDGPTTNPNYYDIAGLTLVEAESDRIGLFSVGYEPYNYDFGVSALDTTLAVSDEVSIDDSSEDSGVNQIVGYTEVFSAAGSAEESIQVIDGSDIPVAFSARHYYDLYFDSGYQYDYAFTEGLLAELGGDSSLGVTWGRWVADASVSENCVDCSYDPYVEYSTVSHFILADEGEFDSLPTYTVPSVANYSFVGGTSPTDHYLRTGELDVGLSLDLFQQEVKDFWLEAHVGDEYYFAGMDRYFVGGEGYSGQSSAYNIFDVLSGELAIALIGSCYGGECGEGEGFYDFYGIPLYGEAYLSAIDDAAESIVGAFGLEAFFYDGEFVATGDLGDLASVALNGTFLLTLDEVVEHPEYLSMATGSVVNSGMFALATTGLLDGAYIPVGGLASASDADFTIETQVFAELSHAVIGATVNQSDCVVCRVEISSGVLTDFEYYTDGDLRMEWGQWASLDDVLFAQGDTPIADNGIVQFAYVSDPALVLPEGPLTGFGSSAYYSFVSGPNPINETGAEGYLDYLYMELDFATQSISEFAGSLAFPSPYGTTGGYDDQVYYYFDLDYEGEGASYDGVGLEGLDDDFAAIVANIPLYGSCSGCGVSTSDYADLIGSAELAFAGENAQFAVGSLGLESLENAYLGLEAGLYSATQIFVLEQEYDELWLSNPDADFAQEGSVVAGSTILDFDPSSGEFLSFGAVLYPTDDASGATALLSELNTDYRYHPNIVTGVSFSEDSYGDVSVALSEGSLIEYDNNLYDDTRTQDVYWGRWMHQDNVQLEGTELATNGYADFIYAPNATAYSYDESDQAYLVYQDAMLGVYSYAGGTSPIDQDGGYGWINDIYMEVDFQNMEIADFSLSAYAGGETYDVSQVAPTQLDMNTPSALIELSGTCSNGECGSSTLAGGTASTAFIGDQAEAAVGAFAIGTLDPTLNLEVNGVFYLEQTYLIDQELGTD